MPEVEDNQENVDTSVGSSLVYCITTAETARNKTPQICISDTSA